MILPGLDAAKLAIAPYLLWVKIGAAVALAGLLWWGWHTVTGWREDSHALEATEKALATRTTELSQCTDSATAAALAYAAAVAKAESEATADRLTAERIEHDLQTRLAAADGTGRDLARRLRDYQARRCRSAVPAAAGAAGQPAVASPESSLDAEIGRATEQVYADCKSDAVKADGWLEWWREIEATRSQ